MAQPAPKAEKTEKALAGEIAEAALIMSSKRGLPEKMSDELDIVPAAFLC